MAKLKRNSHLTNDIAEDQRPVTETATGSAAEEPKPAPTQAELEALFSKYEAAHAVLVDLDAQYVAASDARSETVKALVDTIGNKGPWTVRGVRMSVVARGGKYHMTREGDSKLTIG